MKLTTTLALTALGIASASERHHDALSPSALWSLLSAASESAPTKHSSVWKHAFLVDTPKAEDPPKDPITVTFKDVEISKFAAEVLVGTPPQVLSLVMGITASDLFVINHKVNNHAYYDHTKSSTYRANGTQVSIVVDPDDAIDGFASRDTFTLVASDGASRVDVKSQMFMEAVGPRDLLDQLPRKVDGIIGFGPHGANSTGASSIVRTMIDQKLIDKPVLGLRYSESNVRATFGGLEPDYKLKDFAFFAQNPSSEDPWWSVPFVSIQVDNKPVVGSVAHVPVFDYFSELLVGPDEQIDALADAVGAISGSQLPCDGAGPDLQLDFGSGFVLTLSKEDYTIQSNREEDLCFFALVKWKYAPIERIPGQPWVFGMRLLQRVYTALDFGSVEGKQRIGFAKLQKDW